ncbi:hypothetical protein M514_26928 [Trichuris suis]|uniref:Uncharacterized protein n=1 Tax=Trichuris suis TaxID=68888 RepID=A0A085MUH1_9BILA|nr:hypothetical protein M514_26928 [Trichuris suis]
MKTKSPVKGDPRDMHSETCSGLGCARRRLTGGDGLEKIYIAGRTSMEMYPVETYSGKRKPC